MWNNILIIDNRYHVSINNIMINIDINKCYT